ncbi:MAG: hypothetical protein GKR88_09245 [Flavobacteriaceae bacterium]|nr:MAG: hypothetical protein GKR88_09245 [Flavobacteriaceae bacterium]
MNTKKFNWILYLITITIIITVTVQLYWNYKNYLDHKTRISNEIQISLDNAIEEYYSSLSKENFFAIVSAASISGDSIKPNSLFKDLWIGKDTNNKKRKTKTKIKINSIEIKTNNKDEFKKMSGVFDSLLQIDLSLKNRMKSSHTDSSHFNESVRVYTGKKVSDSLKLIKGLQTAYIAFETDTLDIKRLDSLFLKQLKNNDIKSNYYFEFFRKDSLVTKKPTLIKKLLLSKTAKSTYLKPDEELLVFYDHPSYEALKRSSTGIIISLILSLTVILSLFYLLRIIKTQKQLAEIKNDLISNITHEFKTPIATVATAIEAIENFNVIDDKKKTKQYLTMSSVQLKKLHQMVEKLLETATLDSESLLLKKENVNIVALIRKAIAKHTLIDSHKEIHFTPDIASFYVYIDAFHMENAISNLIDNAVKYGGDVVHVTIRPKLNNIEITVTDNGGGIEKNQQEKIFDKFYRIPKGNTHDIKGFGIGLYYTKKIVEKHHGNIILSVKKQKTIFKITLPNE